MDDNSRHETLSLREALIDCASAYGLFRNRAYTETLTRIDDLLIGKPLTKRGRTLRYILWLVAVLRLPAEQRGLMLDVNAAVCELELHLTCPPR